MTDVPNTTFRRGVVRPVECYKQGWELIKENYWLFLGIAFVASLIGGAAPLGILYGPCMCGLYLCYLRQMSGQKPTFDLMFKGFDHFVQSLIATLIWIVPVTVVVVIGYFAFVVGMIASMPAPKAGGGPQNQGVGLEFMAMFWLFMMVMMVLMVAVQMLVLFTYPLIVDRGLSGIDALKTSVQSVFGNLGGMAALFLLHVLFSMLGACACYVGLIFVLPINFAALAVAYRTVFPSEGLPESRTDRGDDDASEPPVNGA